MCSIEVGKGYSAAEWREDLRRVLKRAGVEGRDVVFLLADSQIVQEGFLEDVNNILNAGEHRGVERGCTLGAAPGRRVAKHGRWRATPAGAVRVPRARRVLAVRSSTRCSRPARPPGPTPRRALQATSQT